ncbi:hypothetical protein [Dapis sp. BLCC M229]|uniref:hypothetical protein n=1 Tax=Dapis sp. BLCC M229 TaxID=3400188 RepID=UPI003CF8E541
MIKNTQNFSKLLAIILVKLLLISSFTIPEKARVSDFFSIAKSWKNVLLKSSEIAEKSQLYLLFILAQSYKVGDYVEVLWEGNWYLGKIV